MLYYILSILLDKTPGAQTYFKIVDIIFLPSCNAVQRCVILSNENKKLNRNFLYGIYITAYSRYDLLNNIVKNCPNTFVYCDTDSIKFIDTGNEFIDMNDYIYENVRDLPYFNNFNRFDYEGYYTEFLTYGA